MNNPDTNPNAPRVTETGVPRDRYPLRSPSADTSYNRTEDDIRAQAEWEWMLDNGLIINRNPPPSPEVVAARDANDRLFRSFAHNRVRTW